MKVSAAVSALEQVHSDKIDFVIVSPEDTAAAADEIEAFGFTALKHGLVVFDAEGEAIAKLPGHQFGQAEIEAALKPLLN